jgi:hypothetical protein
MALSTSNGPQPKPEPVAWPINILIVVVVLAGIAISEFLPLPYFAIGQVAIYAGLSAAIAGQLRTCLLLTKGTKLYQKVQVVAFWFAMGVIWVVAHLGSLFRTESRDPVSLTTIFILYMALHFALELVELLPRSAIVGSSSSPPTLNTTEPTTTPNQPLQQTGGA